MTIDEGLKDFFLIKHDKIIPFRATFEGGIINADDLSLPFEKGDIIFPKEPENLPILSAYIVEEVNRNSKISIVTSPSEKIEDIDIKLKTLDKGIHASAVSQEEKDNLSAKIQELEKSLGTGKFETVYQEFIGLILDYEQYIPAVVEFFKI